MIDQVKNVIATQRMMVLESNIENFDIVAKSYIEEIGKRPNDYQVLTDELTTKIKYFQAFRKDQVPPAVCQMIGETNQDWLSRAYDLGDYGEVSQ